MVMWLCKFYSLAFQNLMKGQTWYFILAVIDVIFTGRRLTYRLPVNRSKHAKVLIYKEFDSIVAHLFFPKAKTVWNMELIDTRLCVFRNSVGKFILPFSDKLNVNITKILLVIKKKKKK